MILITFALPQESGEFRAALRARGGRMGGEKMSVAHLGVGPAAAAAQMRQLLAGEKARLLICAGFAGGLDPELRVGDLLVAENFSSPAPLDRARRISAKCGPLETTREPVESGAAKAALFAATGALAVDMETATVAEMCAAAGVPLLAVRVISDASLDPLPVPFAEWFDLDHQRPRPARLVKFLLLHPGAILPFTRFVRGLAPARRNLTTFLTRFLETPRS